MRTKWITFSLLTFILLLFGGFFAVQQTLFRKEPTLLTYMDNLIQESQEQAWDQAEQTVEETNQLWRRLRMLAMFHFATEDFESIEDSLSRLQGSVRSKDEAEAVIEAHVMQEKWKTLLKWIPEP
ncbi:DUF4363 family protein [Paenibacillus turpanensis]|uniref:DUF4363 family protein n=1 Tax=Paenibacillus turpanensis TaxID=2689078 RepID=UPI00140B7ACD|nr:DUF4363 family protein [Paenibacillus turpanensis]